MTKRRGVFFPRRPEEHKREAAVPESPCLDKAHERAYGGQRRRVLPGRHDGRRVLGVAAIWSVQLDVAYHTPIFAADAHGSAGAFFSPFWMSSIEMLSGVRMKAM
jgi:hypothetical protein